MTKKWSLQYAICNKHTGKMSGLASLSTSCHDNAICAERAKNPDSICHSCYAMKQLKRQPNTEKKNRRNGEELKNRLLSDDEIIFLNYAYFRFEAFGDLETVIQARNYIRIAAKNPQTKIAWFTKNPWFILSAMKEENITELPKNISVVFSSPLLNDKQLPEAFRAIVSHVFTVYDTEHIKAEKIAINCCKHCCGCFKCYEKDSDFYINEKLK